MVVDISMRSVKAAVGVTGLDLTWVEGRWEKSK